MFGKKEQIGIDIQKNIIRYCMPRKGSWIFGEKLANGYFFRENQLVNKEELSQLLNEIFLELKVRRPRVVLAALNSKLLIRQIPLQNMETEKEIREFLFFELGTSISLPFEDPIFDLLILERPSAKKTKKMPHKKNKEKAVKVKTIQRNRFAVNGKVPVVITSKTLLEEMGDVLSRSNAKLVAVDFSALSYTKALWRSINWGECFALVEIDYGEATITIFEEFVPVYIQSEIYNHGNWRYQEVDGRIHPEYRKEQEALEFLGGLVHNIVKYFETTVSQKSKVTQIYLVGGHPSLKKDVMTIIQEQTQLPVTVPKSPFLQRNQMLLPYRFLLAASLAMKGE